MKTSSLIAAVLIAGNTLCAADVLSWPPVTSQTKPWSRWWWLGNIGTKQDFTSEMEKYAAAGLGGLEITPIYGVRGAESRFNNYLSPAWMNLFDHVLDEGQRLGLGIDMSTGTGWPFGGPWVAPETAARTVVTKTYTLKGGAKLAEPVAVTQEPVVRLAGPRQVKIGELTDPVSSNANLQDLSLDQVRFPRKLPLQALVAHSAAGARIDLTTKVGADGKLDWTAPTGDWTLYAVFLGWHGKQVERAAPGGEGDIIDHFSSASLNSYLAKFDAAYAGHRANRLRAYFNDSYEVDDSQGESNWTANFFAEFKRRRGYDLRDELPAFFGADTPEKSSRVASDHRETVSDLLLEEYTVPWAKWAAGHGALVRNQAHGSPANIIDLYAASGIPETEGANIAGMKLASSAAHLTGKPLASSETATWLDEHWSSSLADVKRRVDLMFLGGVNHNCYHGTVFSPPGEAWPGYHFYAAVELDPSNSIWADFGALNAYVTRCQSFLQAGQPANDVLLYYPIYDAWAQRGDGAMPHFSSGGQRGSPPALSTAQALLQAGFTFDYVSDRLLKTVISAGVLHAGHARYQVVLVPETKLMPLGTLTKLFALAEDGATILFHKGLPHDVPGLGQLDTRRSELNALLGVLKSGAKSASGIISLKRGSGRILVGEDLNTLLTAADVARERLVDKNLQFERRADENGSIYFLRNNGSLAFDGWIPLAKAFDDAFIFNPMNGESGEAEFRKTSAGDEVHVFLQPEETWIVRTVVNGGVLDAPKYRMLRAKGTPVPLMGSWSLRFLTGGPALPSSKQFVELKSWTDLDDDAARAFSGTANYTLTFARPAGGATAWQLDLGRVAESARVRLNGKELGVLFTAPFRLTIPADQLQAQNTLEVAVTNLTANRIADLDRRDPSWKKFYNTNYPARIAGNRGADGNFSAAKWTPRPSGLLGPVTMVALEPLAGDR